MTQIEIIEMAKDTIAGLLRYEYERYQIDLILRRAIEINEHEWELEDDEEHDD